MATYLGFDVLELQPNRDQDGKGSYDRSTVVLDGKTGKITVEDKGGGPVPTRTFFWLMNGRAAIQEFKDFETARNGRQVPVWIPTWQQDLQIIEDLIPPDQNMIIESIGYSSLLFSNVARRHIAFLRRTGGYLYRKITAATVQADGYERLTLNSAPDATIPAGTMISFLTLCRLKSDTTKIHWHTRTLAEAEFDVVEIPREVPA